MGKTYHCTKRHLTLIEMLIVLAVLTLVTGVIGVGIGTAINSERFRASASMLVDKLRLAQDIMLILGSNVRVKLDQQSDGLLCTIQAEEGLSPALKAATDKPTLIVGIQDFQFIDSQGKTSTGSVTLDFLSGGSRMSRGKLLVGSKQIGNSGAQQEEIYLAGYPRPIKLGAVSAQDAQPDGEYAADLAALYPKEVLEEERKRNEQKQ